MAMRLRFIMTNPLQRKYLILILFSMLLPVAVVGMCLYYVIFQLTAEQLAIPESIAANLIPVLHKINFLLAVSLPPLIVLLFIWGAILTHRLTGPIMRLEKDLKKIVEGDFSIRLKTRKNDALRSLAELINKAIDKARGR